MKSYRDYIIHYITVSCPQDELPNCSVGVVCKCGFLPLELRKLANMKHAGKGFQVDT